MEVFYLEKDFIESISQLLGRTSVDFLGALVILKSIVGPGNVIVGKII